MNNKKTTKRALLSSVMAIVLCLAMLIGTTFAWFTDSASTGVNKIQAGTLEVGLEMKTGTNADGSIIWENAEGETLAWQKAEGAQSETVLWEPGCTYKLPTLKITNKGNLALQFKVLINNISGDKKLLDAIDFTVDYFNEDPDSEPVSLPVEINENTSIPVELPNPMASDPYYEEYIRELGWTGITLGTAEHIANNFGTDHMCVKISAHMKESAGNEYQGLILNDFAITVVATQAAGYEYDSFNNTYDKDAEYAIPVSTPADLAAALASGNDVILTAPVQMPDVIAISGDVTIYGSENGQLLAPDHKDRVINIADNTEPVTLTLSNLDVVGPETGTYTRGVSVYGNTDVTVVVDNSSVSANYYALNIASDNDSVDVVVKNTTLTGWCAFQTWSAGTKATFENCTLIGNNDKTYNADGWNDFATVVINSDASNTALTFKNCRIEANQTTGNKQYLLSVRADNAKVTLDGCTFFDNGTEIADEHLGQYLNIYHADLVLTIDGEVIAIS